MNLFSRHRKSRRSIVAEIHPNFSAFRMSAADVERFARAFEAGFNSVALADGSEFFFQGPDRDADLAREAANNCPESDFSTLDQLSISIINAGRIDAGQSRDSGVEVNDRPLHRAEGERGASTLGSPSDFKVAEHFGGDWHVSVKVLGAGTDDETAPEVELSIFVKHKDSSARGAADPAPRISVEVGGRGGPDSDPRADAQHQPAVSS